MGMKEPFFEAPMSIRNGVNNPKRRAPNAPIKNMSVPSKSMAENPESPIKNSVSRAKKRG